MNQNIGTQSSWRNNMFPSTGSLFAAYASFSATLTLIQQAYIQFIPEPLRNRLSEIFYHLLRRHSPSKFTLLVEEYEGVKRNPLFDALEAYLCHKVLTTSASCLKATTDEDIGAAAERPLSLRLASNEKFKEFHNGVEIKWVFNIYDQQPKVRPRPRYEWDSDDREMKASLFDSRVRFFKLYFLKTHKDHVLTSYIPLVMKTADQIISKEKVLKLSTLKYSPHSYDKAAKWESVKLNHPSSFETLALAPELKKAIIDDLDLFLERKEFYRKVGRAWKRGYLLYGPPGTGKSSLIAAMANYLKFDVYDLQLMHIEGDNMLRKLLLCTTNRSIVVIEDIDCSMGLPVRRKQDEYDSHSHSDSDSDEEEKGQKKYNRTPKPQISLSGLLNFIDGLWSSCGDERLIIFTTNHKERIDPALLRPGRMDMHINMSYLGIPAFRMLTSKYLDIPLDGAPHPLFGEINDRIQSTNVTPAEVAEELIKSKDADIALEGVVELLKRKKIEMEAEEIAKKARQKKQEEKAQKKAAIKEEKAKKAAVMEALSKNLTVHTHG